MPKQKPESREENKSQSASLAKASSIVALFTLASRMLGLLRDILIAYFFGATIATDAFFTAFKIPNLLRRLVAEGSLSTAFVPVFTEELSRSKEDAKKAFSASISFSLLLTISLVILGLLFSEEVTTVFALGWTDDKERLELAASLLRVMLPYVCLVALLALASSALNALGRFAAPAAAPAILNIAFIGVLIGFYKQVSEPIYLLAYALLLGGALALAPLIFQLSKEGFRFSLGSPFRSPAVKKLLFLMVPTVLSSSIYQLMILTNTTLATMLREGAQTWLYYGDRIFQFPLGVFSLALATAVLPTFSRLASENKNAELSEVLTSSLGWVSYISIPATAGLLILAEPIVSIIYLRGEFTGFDALMTKQSLIAYSLGLWSISSYTILVRAFIAKQDTKTPAIVSSLVIFFNILLAISLMGMPLQPNANIATQTLSSFRNALPFSIDLGHIGLALAGSISSFISLLALFLLAQRKIDVEIKYTSFFSSVIRAILASCCMSYPLHLLSLIIEDPLTLLTVCIPLGVLIYAVTSRLVGAEEAKQVFSKLRRA